MEEVQQEQVEQQEQVQEEVVEDQQQVEQEKSSDEVEVKTFTEEEANKLVEDSKQELLGEIEQLKSQVAELEQYKPVEKSDAELQLEKDKAEIFAEKVDLALQKSELSDFKVFITGTTIDEVNAQIESLKTLLHQRDLNNGYQPNGDVNAQAKQNAYDVAKAKGDSVAMANAMFQ